MKLLIQILGLTVFICLFAGPLWAQQSPFDEGITVNLSADAKKNSFDEKLEKFEKGVTKGMEKAGKAIDVLVKDLDRIFREVKSTSTANSPVIISGNSTSAGTSAQSTSSGTSYKQGEVGSAAGKFWDSLVNLAKKFGNWAKAFWEQITGPGEDEAPISHGLNELNTKLQKWNMGRAWDNFTYTGGQMFGAIGRFFKNAFR
jgi:hypothetical protein